MKIKIAFLIFVASIMYIIYDLNNPLSEKQRIYNEAQTEFNKQNYQKAIVKYDSCIYKDYNVGLAYFYKGICQINLNKIDEGLNNCKKGYKLVPELYDKYYELGLDKYENNNENNNDYTETTTESNESSDIDQYGNNIDDTETDSLETIDYSDLSSNDMIKLGIEKYNNEEYNNAIKLYKIALEKDPKSVAAYYDIGLCYEYLEKYDSAITALNNSLKIDSKYYYSFIELGYSYLMLSKFDKAIKYYKKYLLFDKKSFDAQNGLALAYYKKGKRSKACYLWKKYLKKGNKSSQDYLTKYCKKY